ncbi:tyrosine protein kinase [Bacteroidia bacterium]|nr:tyrosine protein kinase [Bacteroidia bacterium]GHT27009.1 tyrosine protein kinase [Bacteroidia bacterium]
MKQNDFQIDNTREEEISITEIFFHYLKYWKYFILSGVVCVALAVLYLLYTAPTYKITSKIEISDEKKGKSAIDMTAFSDLGIMTPKNNLDNEIEVLSSQTLMRSVVDSLRIGVSYFGKNRLRKTELYKQSPFYVSIANVEKEGAFTVDWINDNSLRVYSADEEFDRVVEIGKEVGSPWGVLVFNYNPFGTATYPVDVVINNPEKLPLVEITPVNKTSSVVNVSLITACPEKGKDIINMLVSLYNRNAIDDKNYVANNTIDFIDDRLITIFQDLQSAEKDVETYRQREGITDLHIEGQLLLTSTSEYSKKITEAEIQLNTLRSIKSFLMSPANSGNVAPSNVGLTDQTVLALIQIYNQEVIEKNKATDGMKSGSDRLIKIENQIASIRDNLLKGINISESTQENTIKELRRQENFYLGKTRGLSSKERESKELFRQQEIKSTIYNYLLQKREETGLSLVLATPNAKIIDLAYYDSIPVKPKKSIILLVALILAFAIPVVIIYIKDLFDNKVHSKEDIFKVVKAPFLGEIPWMKLKDNPFPVLKVRSMIAEQFRIVASNLDFVTGNDPAKVITVTSTTSGEGKSFFSMNLAMSLATTGKKTLLLDLDIRKSVLNQIIEVNTNRGSVMYLSDSKVKIDHVIDSGKYHKNLDIVAIKHFPPNPAELLASARLDQLFSEINEKKYDYVIVDAAPIGLVADVFRINQFSSVTIYLTRMDYTNKNVLKGIEELYRNNRLNKPNIVLNAVSLTGKYGYGNNNGKDYYKEED